MKKIILDLDNFEGRNVSELQNYIRKELDKIKVYYQPPKKSEAEYKQPMEFDLKFIEKYNTSIYKISKVEIEE